MSISIFILLLVIGCAVGFLAGFFGVGGGVILVPVLISIFEMQNFNSAIVTQMAMGTSLFIVIFASVSSAIKHKKNGNIYIRGVLYIGTASIFGAALGSIIASSLSGDVLRKIFAFAVFIVAIRLLIEKSVSEQKENFHPAPLKLVAIGTTVGILSSLTGIGGGVFAIPLMYYIANFQIKKAIGTSSATVIITAASAVIGYIINGLHNDLLPNFTLGYINYLHAIPLIIGTVGLARYGATVANKTSSNWLRKFFALFLIINSLYMFLK